MCSPEGHQTFETLKSKQRGLLSFYLHQVVGNREINLCRSFLIFTVPDNTQQHCGCLRSDVWLKKSSLLMIFSSLIFQAVENVFLSIPCCYTPYKAWKLRETFRKITNNGAPHRQETWIRCIFMSLLPCSAGVSFGRAMQCFCSWKRHVETPEERWKCFKLAPILRVTIFTLPNLPPS